MAKDKRIRLITETDRLGKVSAVNKILDAASGRIIVLCGADLQLEPDSIKKLVRGFSDPKVGMIGARPVPTNDKGTFCGFCAHLVWDLHHRVAMKKPKCGELIAFRNEGFRIPKEMAVDEAWLEWRYTASGWKIAYAPDAIVKNRGPDTIPDYLKQRRRNHALHMQLERQAGYAVSTSDLGLIVEGLAANITSDPRSLVYCAGALLLEGVSIALGAYDYHIAKNNHAVWDVVASTKVVS